MSEKVDQMSGESVRWCLLFCTTPTKPKGYSALSTSCWICETTQPPVKNNTAKSSTNIM